MTYGKSSPLKFAAVVAAARLGIKRSSVAATPFKQVFRSGTLGLFVAAFMVLNVLPAAARGGGAGGHGSGGHESDAGGCSGGGGCGGEDEGGGGHGHSGSGKKGPHGGAYIGRGGSGQSLRDVFRHLDSGTHGAEEDHASSKHSSPKH